MSHRRNVTRNGIMPFSPCNSAFINPLYISKERNYEIYDLVKTEIRGGGGPLAGRRRGRGGHFENQRPRRLDGAGNRATDPGDLRCAFELQRYWNGYGRGRRRQQKDRILH